ncbi:probable E3 ubiquitin ligase complex SCF subunit sconB [Syzygium oleosum]|uniref:probable E3 ubiquitin ligase complex SCF subunit sconB n=1 Tax=Syzygium oleosum TaxID=219896 RepID=UPI0024B9428D|nr:probable E3 ubiquitin ligase complex SCF subunit sconB [Syzygium oleosum]
MDPPPSKRRGRSTGTAAAPAATTTITNVDADVLVRCAGYLTPREVSSMAMSCKFFKRVAYSDAVWHRLYRSVSANEWPWLVPAGFTTGFRRAYWDRLSAVQQFKFVDPLVIHFRPRAPYNGFLLDKSRVVLAQGSTLQILKFDSSAGQRKYAGERYKHKAEVTCMRLFPLSEISSSGGETESEESALVTSSCDRSIRLWWEGECQRCFKGHIGPVWTLSDKLIGEGKDRVLASGGEDGVVRLWSLSSRKRGEQALKSTFYGHEKPVKFISVAGHCTSLLVSISGDTEIRVWDANASSAVRSSCCIGTASVSGAPVNVKCNESLLYVAAGSHVAIIDLRTTQRVSTAATSQRSLYSFGIIPSKSLICTGETGRAMLWDVRKNQGQSKSAPIAELDGHLGPVTHLHMDSYKIVTGGPEDEYVNVWEADTGNRVNSLICGWEGVSSTSGCSAIAVDGCRIVTAACGPEIGVVRLRDFTFADHPISQYLDEYTS